MTDDSSDAVLKVTKRHDFADVLLNQFEIMKDQEYLTDFVLKVDEKEIPCHKVVLAARSEYFSRLFNHRDTLEVSQGYVNFPTLHFTALKLVIEYCYTGILECNMDGIEHVLEVTEHLQIPGLKTDLSGLIVNHLTADNCIHWYSIAKLYGVTTVETRAREMMFMDFSNVVHSPEFLALEFDDLIDYISWQDMNHSTSLIAAARWIMHDCEQRRNKFRDILKIIKVSQCSASALKHIVTNYGPQIVTSLDTGHEFFTAAFSDAPDWQEPGQCVFILGGLVDSEGLFGSESAVNRQSWIISLNTGETIEKSSLPSEILGLFVPAKCNSSKGAFFSGGALEMEKNIFRKPQTQCVIYQKAGDTWAKFSALPAAVMLAAAVCMDAKLYVIGGRGDHKNAMNCLDMTSMTWNPCPNLLQGQEFPVVGCVGHSIYVIFSTPSGNTLTAQGITLQCFDSTTSSWSFKARIPEAVKMTFGAVTVTVDHCLFVLGGARKMCLRYDTIEDAWTILTSPLKRHFFGAAVYLKGRIILSGGVNEDKVKSDVIESYDPATNTWTILPVQLPKPLRGFSIIPALIGNSE